MSNPFFRNEGPINLSEIIELLNISYKKKKDFNFYDISDLSSASKHSITFYQ